MEISELEGIRIGRWTIKKFIRRDKKRQNRRIFLFICDCGTKREVLFSGVNFKRSMSCGCLRMEKMKESTTKHSMARTRFYLIFHGMKARCNNKENISYCRYGKRGIKVLWKSFEEFKKDMYESYLKHVEEFGEKQTTIDRINTNDNYYKNNCRWATYSQQLSNTRRNKRFEFNGEIKTRKEWSDFYKIKTSFFDSHYRGKSHKPVTIQ